MTATPLHARPDLPAYYLTPEDLATMLKLPSKETVYSWRRKGIGPPGFRVGKHLRFDPAVVRAWIAQQTDNEAA